MSTSSRHSIDQIAITSCDFELSTVYGAGIGGGYSEDYSNQATFSISLTRCNGTIVSEVGAGIGFSWSVHGSTRSIDHVEVADCNFTIAIARSGASIGGGRVDDGGNQSITEIKVSNSLITLIGQYGAGIGLGALSNDATGRIRTLPVEDCYLWITLTGQSHIRHTYSNGGSLQQSLSSRGLNFHELGPMHFARVCRFHPSVVFGLCADSFVPIAQFWS
jgi:hypothetical protein